VLVGSAGGFLRVANIEERRPLQREYAAIDESSAVDDFVDGAVGDETLERLVREALGDLPDEIGRHVENVAVVIEDEPPSDRPGILACYFGVPHVRQNEWSWSYPHKIAIFRGPMRQLFGNDPDLFAEKVHRVVRHELAHYFGISDQRLTLSYGMTPERIRCCG
jgi:predicted Zn-dependent protease with MMP-like domain